MKKLLLFFLAISSLLCSCSQEEEIASEREDGKIEIKTVIVNSGGIITRAESEGGKTTGAGLYTRNSNCKVEAIPNQGYELEAFEGNDGTMSYTGQKSYSFKATAPATFTAKFKKKAKLVYIFDSDYPQIGGPDIEKIEVINNISELTSKKITVHCDDWGSYGFKFWTAHKPNGEILYLWYKDLWGSYTQKDFSLKFDENCEKYFPTGTRFESHWGPYSKSMSTTGQWADDGEYGLVYEEVYNKNCNLPGWQTSFFLYQPATFFFMTMEHTGVWMLFNPGQEYIVKYPHSYQIKDGYYITGCDDGDMKKLGIPEVIPNH